MFLKTLILSLSFLLTHTALSQKDKNAVGALSLGEFSISLNVQDIRKSLAFYESIGFKHVPNVGGIEAKWVIIRNAKTTIGLFEGMFSQNTLTFSAVKDARALHKRMKENGIEIVFSSGLDKPSGACSFMMLDPDGNPILIDQFKD